MQDPNKFSGEINDQETEATSKGPLGGLLHSLTQVFASLVAMAQTRLELLTTELQEEIQQAAQVLLWAFVALFAAGIGLFLAALVLIFAFWDTHRVLVSIIVTGAFFAIAAFAALNLFGKLRNRPRMLDGTLTELARDRERLDARIRNRQ
jgi:uncharacterized membrane protein YqjE